MKLKALSIAFFLTLFASVAFGQYRAPKSNNSAGGSSFTDKVYFGGGGGLTATSNVLNVSVFPLAGYKITDSFSAGLQLSYQYVKFQNASTSNYGGGPFANYVIAQKFIIYTQYEYMSFGAFGFNGEKVRLNGRSWFAGLGWNSPLNDNISFQILGLYDVIYGNGENSPYDLPWQIRAGVVVGF